MSQIIKLTNNIEAIKSRPLTYDDLNFDFSNEHRNNTINNPNSMIDIRTWEILVTKKRSLGL